MAIKIQYSNMKAKLPSFSGVLSTPCPDCGKKSVSCKAGRDSRINKFMSVKWCSNCGYSKCETGR